MRCYFHLEDDVSMEEIRDEVGIDVAELEEARAQALKAIAEVLSEDDENRQRTNGWTLRVVNSEGDLLFALPLTPEEHRVPVDHVQGDLSQRTGRSASN